MNINPFVFSYKYYPNCRLATMINQFCSGIQRIFLIFGLLITLVAIFGGVSNWGEALCGACALFVLWLVLKLNKNKWSDKIASRQKAIDNSDIKEG